MEQLTGPGIEANLEEIRKNNDDSVKEQTVEIYSGDWGLLQSTMEAGKYDIILSSDTLYCTANYNNFLDLIIHLLKPGGIA